MALVTIRIERRPAPRTSARRAIRRPVALLAALGLLIGLVAVGSSASAVSVLPVAPKIELNAATVGPNGAVVVAIQAPSDATQVQLAVSVTDATANGMLKARTYGIPAAPTDPRLTYVAGDSIAGTFLLPVGVGDKVQFGNRGAGSITLTVTLTGYSTQVTAADIAPDGGTADQVLTDTGGAVSWQPVGHAYGVKNPVEYTRLNNSTLTTVASVDVPAGSYVVTFGMTVGGQTSADVDFIGCYLLSPGNNLMTTQFGNVDSADPQSVISGQGLLTTNGGTISLECIDSASTATAVNPSLIATAAGTVTGAVTNGHPAQRDARIGVPTTRAVR